MYKHWAGNDILELIRFVDNGAAKVAHSDLQVQDQRAKIVFDLVRVWGGLIAQRRFAEEIIAHHADDHEHKIEVSKVDITPKEVVMLAIEMVDIAWTELQLRGWIIEQPSLVE